MSPILKSLLLAITLIGASIATDIQFPSYNAFTVLIGSNLFTVSKYPSRVIINSTAANYKSCEAPFHVHQGLVGSSIKAAALNTKEKIMVTSVQSYKVAPGNKEIIGYTVLLIDPYACSVKVLGSPNELTELSPLIPPEVVAREDNTFDVFYYSQTTCSPCRYDSDGQRMEVPHQLKPEGYRALEIHVHELSRDQKYAYSYDYGGDESRLKVLDQDFSVISSLSIDPIVRDFGNSNSGNSSYIGAVLKSRQILFGFNYTVFEFKPSELKARFSKRVDFSFDEHIVGASVKIDSKGTSYVAYWKVSHPDGVKIMLARYDARGNAIGDTMEIGRVAFNQVYRVQSFLTNNLEDKQYCLVIHVDLSQNDFTKIKCFDVANMA